MFPCPFYNVLLTARSVQLSVHRRDPRRMFRSLLFGGTEVRHVHSIIILPLLSSLQVVLLRIYRISMHRSISPLSLRIHAQLCSAFTR